ncbi:MAG: 1-deoxy-D-xylulose-5-phosphate reductoisomerase [Phycisphaerae bacterium]
MQKRIALLGSTGSIGSSALEVIAQLQPSLCVAGLAAGSNWLGLAQQAQRFRPKVVAIGDHAAYDDLKKAVPAGTKVLAGPEGLVELIGESDANYVLAAVVGAAGLPAVLAAVQLGLEIGLANKESLVVAGAILMPLARKTGSKLIPVDSEHSAIFQALQAGRPSEVSKIYLTASGGPFREWPAEQIAGATLQQALQHPTWSMGPKITIDSATMMNKALEVIEAHYLFDMPVEKIDVLIHPESIVHSMVEYVDGSVIAQLGIPDMKTPIQYALTYPRRVAGIAPLLNWKTVKSLRFEPPCAKRYPALAIGFEAARRGGSAGAVFNAANEAAVERFRRGEIAFGRIAEITGEVLARHRTVDMPTLDELMEADAWARREGSQCTDR